MSKQNRPKRCDCFSGNNRDKRFQCTLDYGHKGRHLAWVINPDDGLLSLRYFLVNAPLLQNEPGAGGSPGGDDP